MSKPGSFRLCIAFLLVFLTWLLFSIATQLSIVWQWAGHVGVWKVFGGLIALAFLGYFIVRLSAARVAWYKFKDPPDEPVFRLMNLGILALRFVRERLRSENLFDTSDGYQTISVPKYVSANSYARSPDGTFTDTKMPAMGAAGTTFG